MYILLVCLMLTHVLMGFEVGLGTRELSELPKSVDDKFHGCQVSIQIAIFLQDVQS